MVSHSDSRDFFVLNVSGSAASEWQRWSLGPLSKMYNEKFMFHHEFTCYSIKLFFLLPTAAFIIELVNIAMYVCMNWVLYSNTFGYILQLFLFYVKCRSGILAYKSIVSKHFSYCGDIDESKLNKCWTVNRIFWSIFFINNVCLLIIMN